MGSRNFVRTLSVDVSCFLQSHSREAVAKLIHGKYNESFGTPTIQILPRGIARITFRDAAAKQNLLRHDKISLGGRSCKIFAERRFVTVQVHHYPSEAFDCHVEKALMAFALLRELNGNIGLVCQMFKQAPALLTFFLINMSPAIW